MNNTKLRIQFGMVLIEAMVALVVLAAGILGIAKLSAYFIDVSGQSKARTQAVQLAETKLSDLRSLMVETQFTAIATVPPGSAETLVGYSGSNASTQFRRWWTVTNNGTDGREIDVFVSWTDRTNTVQQVAVSSVVAWDDPVKALSAVVGSSGAGSYLEPPTGRAKLGEGTMPVDTSVTPNADGLRKQQGSDGMWRLVDASGNVLLTATVSGEEFSQIEGNVYVDQANLNSLANDSIYIVISDASFCSMLPAKGQNPANSLVNLGSGSVYKYFSYICYVGANWYGNIGVVRIDNANTNDRVCVGDPAVTSVSTSTKTDNRHPALSTIRMYRGYTGSTGSYQSTGIGVQSGSYSAARYNGHDFLLTRITGQPADADCSAKLRLYDTTAPYQPFTTDAQVHTPTTETAYLYGGSTVTLGNPGKFFCFTASCPEDASTAPPTPVTIHITGTVSRSPSTGGSKPTLSSMSTNSGACAISGGSGNNSYTYDCEFTGAGFTGGTWAGNLVVNVGSGQYICAGTTGGSTSTLAAAAPSSPVQNTYTYQFTNQEVNAGNSVLNFRIGNTLSDC